MMTREADYAIRAVLYLARQESSRLVTTSELAEEMLVPYRFLRRIMQKLSEGGFIEAQRGKGGGIRLAQPGHDISLFNVLQTVDPKCLTLNLCLNGRVDCPRAGYCRVRERLDDVQAELGEALRAITFDQLEDHPSPRESR